MEGPVSRRGLKSNDGGSRKEPEHLFSEMALLLTGTRDKRRELLREQFAVKQPLPQVSSNKQKLTKVFHFTLLQERFRKFLER
jgi:hypothetical protein